MVVQVKNNQPKLYQAVQSQFQSLFDAQKERLSSSTKRVDMAARKSVMCFN